MNAKKIVVFNLNVGSAIEYAGDIFVGWLRELGHNVKEYKQQTECQDGLSFLINSDPDLIVINEYYYRPLVINYMYRTLKYVPVIYIDHSWNRINYWVEGTIRNEYEKMVHMWYRHTLDMVSYVFCLNSKPIGEPWNYQVKDKISNRYYPTDDAIFNVTKPWSDRSKMFCYIGNIIPHKLSSDFLAKICETDLVVDCYGSDFTRDNAHGRVFDRAVENGNIVHHGLIPQDKIAEVMNEYKYFVLPHDGYEPFNWVLKQCAFCGTIPLVVNDRNTHLYNGKWLDWAAGLYMGCQYTDDFISNLEELVRDRPDHREMSDFISTAAKIQFPYQEFKEEFQSKARELLNG
jgi:glycosyltransferase involved in cell wall biosynthesis